MDTCSQSELEKDIEDVKLLQEALRYQEDDPSQQQQALRALADILSQNGRAQDYFCLSSGLEYLLSLCKATKTPAVCQATLYTLAMATEGNDISQRAMTKNHVFHLLRSNLQAKDRAIVTTSAFLLLTICADNCQGQNLARETKCLHSLCDIFRSCLPVHKSPSSSHMSEVWFNDIDEDCAKLWNSVVVALHSLLQNPQNAQNQRLCCRLLPMMINTLHLATTQRNVILPTVTLIGAIVSENAECQSKVRLVGGLRALINVFKRFVSLEQPDNQDFCIMEHVVNTIAFSIAGHEMCQESAADLGLVSLLLQCLHITQLSPEVNVALAKQLRTKCVLALSICVDQSERNQQQLRQMGGVDLLVELLTLEQSEEFRRVAIFVLHCITGNSQVPEEKPAREMEKKEKEFCDRSDEQDILSQVASPTRDAVTQTDSRDDQIVCREQSSKYTEKGLHNNPSEKEKLRSTDKPNKRRKCYTSTKEVYPFAKPLSTQLKSATPNIKLVHPQGSSAGTSSAQSKIDCVACTTALNSRNFLPTLNSNSRLCPHHHALGAFLRQKLKDLRKR
ncbi:bouquet formation protein 1 [Porites harrisoni]